MLDTLAYYERLKQSGVDDAIAKAHVYALAEGVDPLVTNKELACAVGRIEARIGARLDAIERYGAALCVAILALLIKVAVFG